VVKDAGPVGPGDLDGVIDRPGVDDNDLVDDALERAQTLRKVGLLVADDQRRAEERARGAISSGR